MYSLIRHGRKTLEFQKWLHLRFAANILLNEPVCGEEDELAAGGSGFVSSGAWIKLGEEDCPKVAPKGLLGSELLRLSPVLSITDEAFLSKYVMKHDDKGLVSELMAIFTGDLPTPDCGLTIRPEFELHQPHHALYLIFIGDK
ncbi:unnamed protein product [Brassica oleracea]